MPRTLFRYFYYAAVLLLFPVWTNAQVLIPKVARIGNPNPAQDAAFGTTVAGIGDVNGDGIGDLIVGAPGLDKVSIISGKDQSVLRTVGDPEGLSKYQFGFSVIGVGDWDGDGVDDFAVSAPGVPGLVPLPCVPPPCKPNPQWGTVDAFPTSATIKQGQSATFTLTVTPTNGFNQAVAFVCTGLPAGASCSFAPATVTPNGGPVTTTLTVTTMAPSIHCRLHEPSNWLLAQGGTFAIAVFLVPGVLRRNGNRRKKFAVTMMLLVIVSLIITYGGGCSSSGTNSGGGTSSVGTPLGTSQVTVSSTAGPSGSASQHGISISITITQ